MCYILSYLGYSAATACCIKYSVDVKNEGFQEATMGNLKVLKDKVSQATNYVTSGDFTHRVTSTLENTAKTIKQNSHEYLLSKKFTDGYAAYTASTNAFSIRHSPTATALRYFAALGKYQTFCYRGNWEETIGNRRPTELMRLTIPAGKIKFSAYCEIVFRISNYVTFILFDLCRVLIGKADFSLTKANYQRLGDITDALDEFNIWNDSMSRIRSAIKKAQTGA